MEINSHNSPFFLALRKLLFLKIPVYSSLPNQLCFMQSGAVGKEFRQVSLVLEQISGEI